MSSASDDELWERVAQDDTDAFGTLFERHARAVHDFLARRTSNLTIAEDLTSVVFFEAWRRRQSTQLTTGSAGPWLLGIANNCARNHQRSLRRYRQALDRLPQMLVAPSAEEDAVARIEAERVLVTATSAIARLTRREQDVVVLVLWSGLTYEETAGALDIPIGTVRSRLASARRHLRADLDPSFASFEEVLP